MLWGRNYQQSRKLERLLENRFSLITNLSRLISLLAFPRDAKKNQPFQFNGIIGLQTCDETHCDPPTGIAFSALINLGKASRRLHSSGLTQPTNPQKTRTSRMESQVAQSRLTLVSTMKMKEKTKPLLCLPIRRNKLKSMKGLYDPNEKQKIILFDDLDEFPVGSGGSSSLEKTTFITALFGSVFWRDAAQSNALRLPGPRIKSDGICDAGWKRTCKNPKTRYRIRVWTGRLHVDPGGALFCSSSYRLARRLTGEPRWVTLILYVALSSCSSSWD